MDDTNNTQMPVYKFSSFTEDMVKDAFNLKQELDIEGYLSEWIGNANNIKVEEDELQQLKRLNHKLRLYVRSWNEQELREKFITFVIQLVDFDMYDLDINGFAEREMKVIYNNSVLKGKVEWMAARGTSAPKQPFFFIHEYKKEKEASNDPLGQLLVTLCSAEILNSQKPKPSLFNPNPMNFENVPLYGIYIIGRFWFFVRLKNKRFFVSEAYNAQEMEDLIFIFKMLKAQKQMIIHLNKQLTSIKN